MEGTGFCVAEQRWSRDGTASSVKEIGIGIRGSHRRTDPCEGEP